MSSFEFGTSKAPEGLFDDWDERFYPWLPADNPYQDRYRRGRIADDAGASRDVVQAILRDPNPLPPCDKPCCVPEQVEGLL